MRHWQQGVAFGMFCLLAGSRWLVENAYPSSLPPLLPQAVHLGVVALAALAFWLPRRGSLPRAWLSIGLAGVLLFALPPLLNEVAGEVITHAGAALFTLVPLFVAIVAAATYPEGGSRAMMLPAMVSSAGGLLLLPFELPSTGYGGLLLGAVLLGVMVTASASLWLHRLLRGVPVLPAVIVISTVSCVVLGSAGLWLEGVPATAGWGGELLRGFLLDAPMSVLLIWLLREVVPIGMAARYLLVPLVTVVEGMVLLRPRLELRAWFGMALLLGGSGVLLAWKGEGAGDAPARLGL